MSRIARTLVLVILTMLVLGSSAFAWNPPGQRGYEGQPGNQGQHGN